MKRTILVMMAALYGCGGGDEGHDHGEHEHTEGGEHTHDHDHDGEHHDHAHEHDGEHAHEHDEEAEEHAHLPPALDAYHQVFHPVWHGDEGTRGDRACTHAAELVRLADAHHAWATAEPPEGVPQESYDASSSLLVERSQALADACAADAANLPEGIVSGIHDPLHDLMHAFVGEHGDDAHE